MKLSTMDNILADEIKYYIKQNNLSFGDKIPSERELCEIFDVQRLTIRAALSKLINEKVIEKKDRSGYYVCKGRIKKSIFYLGGVNDEYPDYADRVNRKILNFATIELDKSLSEKMGMPIGTRVYKISKIRIIEDEPVAIDISYIPKSIAPDLECKDVEARSMRGILKQEYGIEIESSEEEILPFIGNREIYEALCIEGDAELVLQRGIIFDKRGIKIEYCESFMKMDRFIFSE